MARPIPFGFDDFRLLREAGLRFVDKSSLIRGVIDAAGVQVMLMPRPRRFGKSLNLSMLRCWFEKRDEDLSNLFSDLAIWQAGDAYRAHFQRHPVIYFNFKAGKGGTFEEALRSIRRKLAILFEEHGALLTSGKLTEREARDYRQVIDGSADLTIIEQALLDLSRYLRRVHGERVVILIDEYDEPIHEAYFRGYADDLLAFMRAFLGAGLKSNPHLFKAVLTGVLRIAKESLFSDLNNIGIYTLLRPELNTSFGFTEAEVITLLEEAGWQDKIETVRKWYNGYLFGGEVIYNPWSLCGFLGSIDAEPRLYWLQTSSNRLVKELLERYALSLQPVFEALLEGGSIERPLNENVVLLDIRRREDALWSLLVFSGYLKAERAGSDMNERPIYRLSIPNREVREVYATTFQQWMQERMESAGGTVEALTTALLAGDGEGFEEQLQLLVTHLLSYHDVSKHQPERVYHGFVVGLLAAMEPVYQVRSNRESGTGRPDVIIRPLVPGKPGVVLELKVAKGHKTLDQALDEGIAQIASKDYSAELTRAGAGPVHAFAVAFDGKSVRVRALAQKP